MIKTKVIMIEIEILKRYRLIIVTCMKNDQQQSSSKVKRLLKFRLYTIIPSLFHCYKHEKVKYTHYE